MKTILTLALSLICMSTFAQFCTGGLWSQADVDNFPIIYRGCTEIGELNLEGDVSNLDGHYMVDKISGNQLSFLAPIPEPYPAKYCKNRLQAFGLF